MAREWCWGKRRGDDDAYDDIRDKIGKFLKDGAFKTAAAWMAKALVAAIGLANGLATVIGTLIVLILAKAAGDTICDIWSNTLPKAVTQ